jgi:hypothetical protein
MNRKTTLILVSVLILLGLYTYYYQASKNAPSPAATPAANTAVWNNTTADQITALLITEKATNKQVAVSKDAQNQWQVTQPEAKLADAGQLATLTTSLATLTYMANITSTTDLSPFGLVNPAYVLEAKLSTGASLKAYIGDKIPTGNGYYLLRDGDKTPLAVPDTSLQPFIDLLANPPYVPTPTPVPAPGTLTSPTVVSP